MIKIQIRELFVWKVIIISILVVLSTEILSIFDAINYTNIKIFWALLLIIFLAGILYLHKKKIIYLKTFEKNGHLLSFNFFFILLILFLTFLNSLLYPPNTADAMAYHMPKVMHWIQNNNINFYPTDDLRQLTLAPFAEFVILHLHLLSNVDNFSNLVQWYSMFISCLTVSLIAKEFGCDYKYQIFSVLFCATLPMGILQSTSTQTDYVASMWLIITAYFILKYINSGFLKYIFGFAFSLGLGILTKGTTYIFAFPFCIWIGFYVIMKNRKHFIYLFIIPLMVLILNIGHFNRNINLFGNPLGFNKDSVSTKTINEVINIKTMTSNLIRNIGLNLSVPNKKINIFTAQKITSFLNHLNISTEDPATTWIPRHGYYIPFSFYESTAPNTLHFIIILLLIFFIICRKKLSNKEKNYYYSIIAGFIFFSLLLKWTAAHNRLLLNFFVLCSPMVGFLLFKYQFNKLSRILVIGLLLYSFPYILFNKSRPLLAEMNFKNGSPEFSKPFFLTETREELYFIANRFYNSKKKEYKSLYEYYSKAVEKIKMSNCDRVGFNSAGRNIEYPLWVLLKKKFE